MEFFGPLYEKAESMWVGFVKMLPLLGIGLFTLIMTWILASVLTMTLSKSLQSSNLRPSLRKLFCTLLKVVIWTMGSLVATTIIFPSLTPAKLLAAMGLGSIAIGFAFKDIFENFIAGILIMLRRPMRIGDYIECEGVEGTVENISVRETYLRKTDDQLVILPNSFLFKNPVYILTDRHLRRFDIVVGVAYGENVDECRGVIETAMKSIDLINQNKPVEVWAREFNSSSVDFTVRWWAESTPIDLHKTRDQVVSVIKAALDEAGIEIPFPYRTMTFSEPLRIITESTGPASKG